MLTATLIVTAANDFKRHGEASHAALAMPQQSMLVLVLIARPPPPNAPASQKRLRRDANRKIRAFGGSKSETVISVTPRVHVYTFNF